MGKIDQKAEWMKCESSAAYFIHNYVKILSAEKGRWIPFRLWPAQVLVIEEMEKGGKIVVAKSRQIGFTWLSRALFLHRAIFRPVANAVVFSKSDSDAKKLLSKDKGLKGMWYALPEWLQRGGLARDNEHEMVLMNGSIIECRPYTQAEGDTYTHCLIDEADRFPHDTMEKLLMALRPALENAELVMLGSIVDKERPQTMFKNIVRGALEKRGEYRLVFLPWRARPDRDDEWYEAVKREAIDEMFRGDEEGALDWLGQQYPGSIEEALKPSSQSKRVPWVHLRRIFKPEVGLREWSGPAVAGAVIYREPEDWGEYGIGADPAEGVGGSESAAHVIDLATGEQVAMLAGFLEPKEEFPAALWTLARYYNNAAILVELNNHGVAVIAWLESMFDENRDGGEPFAIDLLTDPFTEKVGYSTTRRSKVYLYDTGARIIKDGDCVIHDQATLNQIGDIDRATLKATRGNRDDRSDAFMLAQMTRQLSGQSIEGDVMA